MNGSSVAVLTPTLPERAPLLAEAVASVRAQTISVEHLVGVDESREGPATIRNRLAADTHADWLLPLDDDDLLDPDCAELLVAAAGDADVVYPWCRVEGSEWSPNRFFRASTLRHHNFIPVTALVRRDLWERVGGWKPGVRAEDWVFWRDCIQEGARFACLPEVLWTYRISPGSRNEWTVVAPAKAA